MAHGLSPIPIPCEAARYRPEILYVPSLWAAPGVWRGWAGFLGHRGWAGHLVSVREVEGGIDERARRVAALAREQETPPILVGHGAGALVAALAARDAAVTALVLVAPLVPGASRIGRLVLRWDAVLGLITGATLPPPPGEAMTDVLARIGTTLQREIVEGLAADTGAAVLDVVRPRPWSGACAQPTLVVHGANDAIAPVAAARRFAAELGAEILEVADGPHWLLAAPDWRVSASAVHRWLVSRLPEGMLDFYAEAMADRGDDDGE